MKSKYYNDAIIGNKNITASFSKKGELLRLFYPTTDYKQFVEELYAGVKINDSAIIYLHDDINNVYNQEYIENTNILKTEILNTYFNLSIEQTDFVPIKEDILVKNYKFINQSNIDITLNFLMYSKILSNINNDTAGYIKNDCLIQYNHDYSICIFSKNKLGSYQVNNSKNTIGSGIIGGKDYIGLSSDSSISYDLEVLKPGEEKEISICIYINDNSKLSLLNELDNEIERIRKIDMKKLFNDTKKYWRKYVDSHDLLNIQESKLDFKLKQIYIRSILLFNLLTNKDTGGISAGIEVDEKKEKCGRYSYCWPRDAVFITKAFDIVGMNSEIEKFYKVFCKKTQSKNGMWEQRFYTDGRLAPSWGYQIDETASVVFGVYEHYQISKDKKFLKDTLKMCENATEYLEKYVIDIIENKNEFKLSYDLWEEFEGISLYSLASIFGAFEAMKKMLEDAKELFESNRLKLEAIRKKLLILEELNVKLKDYCKKNFYDIEKNTFVRNHNDKKLDISILGTVTPFGMFKTKEKFVENTIEKINMTLRTYTGGYIRYENDGYMGGYNPWPISNLWMANYCIEKSQYKEAVKNFKFVVDSANEKGLLGEQVNNQKMKPEWVIGLTWSHAMFIITLEKLIKLGII